MCDTPSLINAFFSAQGALVDVDGLIYPRRRSIPLPWIIVASHEAGFDVWMKATIPAPIRQALATLDPASLFTDEHAVRALLAGCSGYIHPASRIRVEASKFEDPHQRARVFDAARNCLDPKIEQVYTFPEEIARDPWVDVRLLDEADRLVLEQPNIAPACAVVQSNMIVSLCQTAAEDHQTALAWVRTKDTHRRQGFAAAVTARWAQEVRNAGKLPLYAHSIDNEASEAVARRLALIPAFISASYQ